MERLNVKQNAFIFREGDQGDAAYVVDVGSIAIVKSIDGEAMRLATIRPGGMFGEMAILDGSPRMASAQAVEDTTVFVVPRRNIESKLNKSDPSLRTVFRVLVQNLRNVHHAYIKRPRSTQDFLNLIDYNLTSLGAYMDKVEDRALADATRGPIRSIALAMLDLKRLFDGHADRRSSVLEEAELMVPCKRVQQDGN